MSIKSERGSVGIIIAVVVVVLIGIGVLSNNSSNSSSGSSTSDSSSSSLSEPDYSDYESKYDESDYSSSYDSYDQYDDYDYSSGYDNEPADEPTTTTSSSNVYYANCSAARAAGAAPIYRGEAGYRAPLDRDNDGVACEPYYGNQPTRGTLVMLSMCGARLSPQWIMLADGIKGAILVVELDTDNQDIDTKIYKITYILCANQSNKK